MMEDIQFFSKIQDQLLYLGNPRYNSAILSVVVNLMSTNYQGDANYFYHEVVYPSSKMNTITTKVRRTFNTYLALENTKPLNGNYREYIVIKGRDLELLKAIFVPYVEAVFGSQFKQIFAYNKQNKLMVNTFKPRAVNDIGGSKCIKFAPGMYFNNQENEFQPGLELILNNPANMVVINVSQAFELIYIIKTLDLYTYGANMVNFIGKPPIGTNRIILESNGMERPIQQEPKQEESKRIIVEKKKVASYFNRKNTTNSSE